MINIIKLFIKILSFISLFDKELTMSVNPWSTGDCVVSDSSKYSIFMLVQSTVPVIAIRNGNSIIGFSVIKLSDSNGQNIRTFQAVANGDIWTMTGGAHALVHNPSSTHGSGLDQSITAIRGLVPLS